ncbi:5-formyltetrahydrofolate cyclo-ligase [Parasphingopyxis marina]|uniref:5-formyltetrahydrofolate cyclo-ligase n=1 Tax=Parasphingopyxis marina TaxID=2761622 RepID=A0A842HU82_9SPHN|nr:5-formyltetrahydrofolate cyclo-ligase [Parasphingopyxis marina]MBC2776582.1 5-formyltetrahydrofolate cyclo-ligase [Parasphingopyxis marina]
MQDSDAPRPFASPACSMHEIDPAYAGTAKPADIAAWRKAERARLIEARMAIPADERERLGTRIAEHLRLQIVDSTIVSGYWPFRGEPDLRPLMKALGSAGLRIALPVVIAKGQPLVFREWRAGTPLARGVWNIPIPAEGAEVMPDMVIAPVVGFDPPGYRLGYGGGFFDRTLAAMPRHPRVVGVGYRSAAIPTIHPQAHDIPMDLIVTEQGVELAASAGD